MLQQANHWRGVRKRDGGARRRARRRTAGRRLAVESMEPRTLLSATLLGSGAEDSVWLAAEAAAGLDQPAGEAAQIQLPGGAPGGVWDGPSIGPPDAPGGMPGHTFRLGAGMTGAPASARASQETTLATLSEDEWDEGEEPEEGLYAVEQSFVMYRDETLERNLDVHPGETELLTLTLVENVQHGTLTLLFDPSEPSDPTGWRFRYAPDPSFVGQDHFAYVVSDGQQTSEATGVDIHVLNSLPQAQDDQYVTAIDTVLSIPAVRGVLANDFDPDGDALAAALETAPEHGQLSFASDGSFAYTPDPGYLGSDAFEYVADDGFDESYVASVSLEVVAPQVDLDADSDNSGVVEGTPLEDSEEMAPPGNVLRRNVDDDNGNGQPDWSDGGPLRDSQGRLVADDELEPLVIRPIDALGVDLTGYTLTLESLNPSVALWRTSSKHPLPSPAVWRIGIDEIPETVYAEGVVSGTAVATLTLRNPAGREISSDSVLLAVADTNLTAYRPQTEQYGQPFARTPVPDDVEQEPGAGIRRNGDDDNQNGVPDRLDTGVAGENDLVEAAVVAQPAGVQGLQYRLTRTTADLWVWRGREKTGQLLGAGSVHEAELPQDLDGQSVWVEWATPNGARSALTLTLWDTRHAVPLMSDTLEFYAFQSVVIVLGGEGETPSDPANGGEGLFRFAVEQYRNGYDVHMYSDDDVAWFTGAGRPYEEIVSAVNDRGVTQVAMIGYSHGGGAVYDLSHRLNENVNGSLRDINRPFRVVLTGYVDAITSWTAAAENRRPLLSEFHVNQYQTNSTWLDGSTHGGPSDGDDDIDRSYLGVVHGTIDDHPVVLNFLEMRLNQRVER